MRTQIVKLEVLNKDIEVIAPNVRAVKLAMLSQNEFEQSIKMAAACTNMTADEIESLDLKDFMAIQAVLQDFLQGA